MSVWELPLLRYCAEVSMGGRSLDLYSAGHNPCCVQRSLEDWVWLAASGNLCSFPKSIPGFFHWESFIFFSKISDDFSNVLLTKKRCTAWELWVKLSLGQYETHSPGDSTTDNSEKLLQRGSGGKSIYKILVKGEFDVIKHLSYKRFSASYKELMSPWRGWVLF